MTARSDGGSVALRDAWWVCVAAWVSGCGLACQLLAAPWYGLQLTGKASAAGVTVAAATVGLTVGAAVGGTFADRFNVKAALLAVQGLLVAVSAVLAVAVWLETMSLASLVVGVTVSGVLGGVSGPLSHKLLSSLAPAGSLLRVFTWNSMQSALGRAVGPMFGGLVLVWFGAEGAFAANGVSYLAYMVAVGSSRPRPQDSVGSDVAVWDAVVSQVRMLFDRRLAAIWGPVAVLYGSVTATMSMLAPFAEQSLGVGGAMYGLLVSCFGVGGGVAGLAAGRVREAVGAVQVGVVSLFGVGVAVLTVAVFNVVWVAAVGFAVAGAGNLLAVSALQTGSQVRVGASERGRASAALIVCSSAAIAVSSAGQGVLGDVVGARGGMAVVGATALVAATVLVGTGVARQAFSSHTPVERLGEVAVEA